MEGLYIFPVSQAVDRNRMLMPYNEGHDGVQKVYRDKTGILFRLARIACSVLHSWPVVHPEVSPHLSWISYSRVNSVTFIV